MPTSPSSLCLWRRQPAITCLALLSLSLPACRMDARSPPHNAQGQQAQEWSLPPNLNPTQSTVNLQQAEQSDPDVKRVAAEIDSEFASALAQAKSPESLEPYQRMNVLGKLLLFDKNLSVNKDQACTTCHSPSTGFTGGVDLYNRTTAAYPGAVDITNATGTAPNVRISARKPQSYGYAPFAPILEYRKSQGDFVGGNFWDMRATGNRLGNPAAEQAMGPPTNPLEMALPDPACAVYRISQSQYRPLFELVWGAQSFAINWPADVEKVCSTPAPPPANDPLPVHLTPAERGIANDAYEHMVMAIAIYEASPAVSPFSSKFDAVLAGNAQLTAEEARGFALFRGKAKCNTCHVDGSQATVDGGDLRTGITAPLFTDFSTANIGVPANLALPFRQENQPDQSGYVANPDGTSFVDLGVGAFLASGTNANPSLRLNPNPSEWAPLAPRFNGAFQVPTLRNVDRRPRPDFVKAYGHNGYFKSLKEVVHFYNTSQALPRCAQGSPGENVTCWPPPEVADNLNTTEVGNLGLTDAEENDIVSFLKTLTDGFGG